MLETDYRDEARRPGIVKLAILLQAILVSVIALVWMGWAGAASAARAHLVSAAIFGPLLAFCAVSLVGMVRGKTYGWALGLLGALATAAVFVVFSEAVAVFPVGMIGVLMLRGVREFFTRHRDR